MACYRGFRDSESRDQLALSESISIDEPKLVRPSDANACASVAALVFLSNGGGVIVLIRL